MRSFAGDRATWRCLAVAGVCLVAHGLPSPRPAIAQQPAVKLEAALVVEPPGEVDPDDLTQDRGRAVLRRLVGRWAASVRFYPNGPNGPKYESKATETNRLLGGLWLLSSFEGKLADMDFASHGQFGFDASRGKYVASWVDNMVETITLMEGTYDPETRTLSFEYENIEPQGDPTPGRSELQLIDVNTRVFRMLGVPPGGDRMELMLEVDYRRLGESP
jgi:hypothetical protein